jgi:hypothetical protein
LTYLTGISLFIMREFVHAWGLGLQLLGRGDKVSEFIKRGEDSAEVSITLCTDDPRRPLLVTRVIRKDNSSDWKMNGEAVWKPIIFTFVLGVRCAHCARGVRFFLIFYYYWWLTLSLA